MRRGCQWSIGAGLHSQFVSTSSCGGTQRTRAYIGTSFVMRYYPSPKYIQRRALFDGFTLTSDFVTFCRKLSFGFRMLLFTQILMFLKFFVATWKHLVLFVRICSILTTRIIHERSSNSLARLQIESFNSDVHYQV